MVQLIIELLYKHKRGKVELVLTGIYSLATFRQNLWRTNIRDPENQCLPLIPTMKRYVAAE
jgi:hypothetical protein